jgi:hypothetical protein
VVRVSPVGTSDTEPVEDIALAIRSPSVVAMVDRILLLRNP